MIPENDSLPDSLSTDTSTPKLVIIDDDPEIQVFLKELYTVENYELKIFSDGESALNFMRASKNDAGDVLICDLKLPDIDGITFIEKLHELRVTIPVILITAHAAIETAVEALQKGAFDYITKPIKPIELSVVTRRALRQHRLEKEFRELQKRMDTHTQKGDLIIGKSHKMSQIYDLVRRVSKSSANVLITGESGTGKEVVARTIHAESTRVDAPFIAINCSAIPDQLLESELFGHQKGSFTGANETRNGLFAEADGGTIFLDEIGDMPLALQAKLLRVLQEKKVKPVGSNEMRDIDVRIIAATHKDLRKAIKDGSFREDLYFRLCVVPIQLPALRERSEDIPILVNHFLKKYCRLNDTTLKHLSKNAIAKLMRLSWPGNVRELENTIERAVVLAEHDFIDESDIRTEISFESDSRIREIFSKLPTLEQLEREYIAYVLNEMSDHKEKAAEVLGINRKTLYRKEREYGTTKPSGSLR